MLRMAAINHWKRQRNERQNRIRVCNLSVHEKLYNYRRLLIYTNEQGQVHGKKDDENETRTGDLYSPTQNAKLPAPKQTPKNFAMLQMCIKLQKSLKMEEKIGKKQFSIEIFACHF